jgi:integrase
VGRQRAGLPLGRRHALREPHVRDAWIVALRRARLPESVRMHDLRHTFATIMLANGEDLVAVQRSLGHSRVNMTADLYIGRVSTAQKRTVEQYGELLAGAGGLGPARQQP